ncbi:AN1-type zinc finger protein [Colletotrichum scovillei]|uniref:AN1-type zinc finger protein n=15 Tax=Colletotrichum acutatum species complex TaxID=2707335 RepID=A0A9P7RDN5_9PEZI|nr:AN1-type zinc finger protein [Colletotrichum scovillei]
MTFLRLYGWYLGTSDAHVRCSLPVLFAAGKHPLFRLNKEQGTSTLVSRASLSCCTDTPYPGFSGSSLDLSHPHGCAPISAASTATGAAATAEASTLPNASLDELSPVYAYAVIVCRAGWGPTSGPSLRTPHLCYDLEFRISCKAKYGYLLSSLFHWILHAQTETATLALCVAWMALGTPWTPWTAEWSGRALHGSASERNSADVHLARMSASTCLAEEEEGRARRRRALSHKLSLPGRGVVKSTQEWQTNRLKVVSLQTQPTSLSDEYTRKQIVFPPKQLPIMPQKKIRCTFKECKDAAQRIVGDCGFCNGHFCGKHRLLEDHKCDGLEDCKKQSHERNAAQLESERTQVIRGV